MRCLLGGGGFQVPRGDPGSTGHSPKPLAAVLARQRLGLLLPSFPILGGIGGGRSRERAWAGVVRSRRALYGLDREHYGKSEQAAGRWVM